MKSLVFALLPVIAVAACGSDDPAPEGTTPADTNKPSNPDNNVPGQNPPVNNQPGTEQPAPPVPTELFGFVGSNDGYLRVYRVNPQTGAWTPATETKVGSNPWWAAFDPAHKRVVAVDELSATVHSYNFDAKTGALTEVNSMPSGGESPVHVAISPNGKWVTVANYGGGNTTIRPIAADGTLGEATDTEMSGAGSHWAAMDPLGHDVFVAAVDRNVIAQYRFDENRGRMIENGWGDPPPGAGVRHVAIHPNMKWAYAINKNHTNVSAYFFDPNFAGKIWPINNTSALPQGQDQDNDEISGAEIFIHPNGQWVYASTRGYNSIASFTINQENGKLTLAGSVETGASQPRSFGLDPEGTFLFAGNQDADHVVGFKIESTGALTSIGKVLEVPKPTFVGLARFN